MRKALVLGTAAASLSGLVLAGPASAADDTTSVTFTVTSGGLSIDAPASLALSGAGGALSLTAGSVSGTMSTVTITDARGGLGIAGWSNTVSSTDFTTADNGGGTITKDNATVSPGVPVAVSGAPVLVPSATPVNLSTGNELGSHVLVSATSATGSNQATLTPTVSVTVPTNAIPGAYTGTVTQTVV